MYLIVGVYYVFTFIGYSKYLTFPRVKRHKPFSFPPAYKILNKSANEVMAYNLSKLFSTHMHQLLIYYKYRKNTYQSVQNLYFIHYFATKISITFLAIQATRIQKFSAVSRSRPDSVGVWGSSRHVSSLISRNRPDSVAGEELSQMLCIKHF